MTGCTAMKRLSLGTDQSALLALKAHITSGQQEFLPKNWSSAAAASSVCDWIGVQCSSRHQRVTALNISNMGLTGTIPPDLGNLSFLVSLDLRNNSFHGNLPEELSHLRRLRFVRLTTNNFTGEIPMWFGHFPELQFLFLDGNGFSGFIPSSISNLSRVENWSNTTEFMQDFSTSIARLVIQQV
nr:putative receptor-like protein kinase At3g47110 [Coffea arabica]